MTALESIVDELVRLYDRGAPPRMKGFASKESKIETLIHDWLDLQEVAKAAQAVVDAVDKGPAMNTLIEKLAILDTGREERGLNQ